MNGRAYDCEGCGRTGFAARTAAFYECPECRWVGSLLTPRQEADAAVKAARDRVRAAVLSAVERNRRRRSRLADRRRARAARRSSRFYRNRLVEKPYPIPPSDVLRLERLAASQLGQPVQLAWIDGNWAEFRLPNGGTEAFAKPWLDAALGVPVVLPHR